MFNFFDVCIMIYKEIDKFRLEFLFLSSYDGCDVNMDHLHEKSYVKSKER